MCSCDRHGDRRKPCTCFCGPPYHRLVVNARIHPAPADITRDDDEGD